MNVAVASASDPVETHPMPLDDFLAQPTEVQGGLEQMGDRGQALLLAGMRQVLGDPVEHLLRRGQVARGLHHERAVGPGVDHVQLAVGADVVEAGIGAGVGDEDQGVFEAQGEAVGHRRRW